MFSLTSRVGTLLAVAYCRIRARADGMTLAATTANCVPQPDSHRARETPARWQRGTVRAATASIVPQWRRGLGTILAVPCKHHATVRCCKMRASLGAQVLISCAPRWLGGSVAGKLRATGGWWGGALGRGGVGWKTPRGGAPRRDAPQKAVPARLRNEVPKNFGATHPQTPFDTESSCPCTSRRRICCSSL